MKRSAVISSDGVYRYRLERCWGDGGYVRWIMLNPSTADGTVDDPTIRRCIGYSQTWGYGGLVVLNLYAFRATKPTDLWTVDDPVGPENNDRLAHALAWAAHLDLPVIAAWGEQGRSRENTLRALPHADRLSCLAVTKHGHPAHPLYLRADLKPIPWRSQ